MIIVHDRDAQHHEHHDRVRMIPSRGTSSSSSRSRNVRLTKPVAITTKKMQQPALPVVVDEGQSQQRGRERAEGANADDRPQHAVNKAPMGRIKTTLIGSLSLAGRRRRSKMPKTLSFAGGVFSIEYEQSGARRALRHS